MTTSQISSEPSAKTEKIKVGMSIRKKLFFLVLIAFTFLIVATSWQIGVQANKVSGRVVERSLHQSSIVLNTKITSRFASINEVATGIAKDGRVLPLVFDIESSTLQDLSLEFQRVLEFDILFFTSADGEILARSDRPEAIGQNIAGRSELFDTALAGKESHGYFVSRGKILQIVVVPIFDNVAKNFVRGSVALAYEFTGEMAQEINALTASDIGFFVFDRDQNREISGAHNTYMTNQGLGEKLDAYFSDNPESWKSISRSADSTYDMKLFLNEEDFYSVVQILANEDGTPLGFVMVLRSRTELIKPFLDIQRIVIVIGIICLVGASVFAWIFSLRISRPIVELVDVARSIQEGSFDKAGAAKVSNDEVGVLYNAVITMGKNLKEKAELENYLAQMSEELNIQESLTSNIDETTFADDDVTELTDPDDEDATIVDNNSGGRNSAGTSEFGAGQVIDNRYEVIRIIGSGAMGKVYLAKDRDLDENVAIKMMNKEIFSQQESINFKEEIRLARRITHRNILRTFDFGAWEKYYYITMEYVLGYDLDVLLKTKGAFDTQIGLVMAKQICSAMNAAHEQGIIHRDLKPSNMMINRQGILKIMDFGLAMSVELGDGEKQDNRNTSNVIAGTPRYMAPEQFFNWQLDTRTDIYAIGVILFAIFNGSPPFNSRDIEKLAEMHLNGDVPKIMSKSGEFPKELEVIIHKTLEKKPEHRYQTVRELMDDLNSLS